MQNREEQTREIDVQVQVPGSRQADCGFKAHHRTRTETPTRNKERNPGPEAKDCGTGKNGVCDRSIR